MGESHKWSKLINLTTEADSATHECYNLAYSNEDEVEFRKHLSIALFKLNRCQRIIDGLEEDDD